jgi:hypothetical protein
MTIDIEQLRYPIGKFNAPETITSENIAGWIAEIEALPGKLADAVNTLTDEQLATPYRPDGWMVKQVVHHLSDSHINAFVRFKLTLTEHQPIIKPYFEERWANLADGINTPITVSLSLLTALHSRWAILLHSLTNDDFEKMYVHPQYNYTVPLKWVVGNYAWHGNHHLRHITALKERNNW